MSDEEWQELTALMGMPSIVEVDQETFDHLRRTSMLKHPSAEGKPPAQVMRNLN